MKSAGLEKDLQKACLSRLSIWQMHKVVVYYQDISQFGLRYFRGNFIKRTHKGLPDIVAYVKYNQECHICFFELKTGTKQSDHQLDFMLKFKDLSNVWYDIIRNSDEIDNRIEILTNHYKNQLDKLCL